MSKRKPAPSAIEQESPESILQRVLTLPEEEALRNIKYELGLCVKWGSLTEQLFSALLKGLDDMVFSDTGEEDPQLVKRNPYEALFDKDQELINSPSKKSILSRKYVLVLLLKKLLGAVKTRVNRELDAIEIIDQETEMELRKLLVEGPDEEEMDLVGRRRTTEDGREIIAQVDLAEDRGCEHHRITLRQVRAEDSKSGKDELHSYCKECRQPIRVDILKDSNVDRRRSKGTSPTWREEPRACRHREIHWREGFEGRIAECGSCQEEIPDPDRYQWEKVGLEPFGDDPSKDEIIVIPSRKQEVAA